MKLLLLFVLISNNVYAENEFKSIPKMQMQLQENFLPVAPTPINNFIVSQTSPFSTIRVFYKLAIQEYKNANYGTAKELFEATVQRTDAFPEAYFYLGNIYGDVEPFKNPKLSKKYYKMCLAHKKSSKDLKKICYIHLE